MFNIGQILQSVATIPMVTDIPVTGSGPAFSYDTALTMPARHFAQTTIAALNVIAEANSRAIALGDFKLRLHQHGSSAAYASAALSALRRHGWVTISDRTVHVTSQGYAAALKRSQAREQRHLGMSLHRRRHAGSWMARGANVDPHGVAAGLDELVEQAYAIMSRCDVPGGLTEHQAINELLRLFESGRGFKARCQAEQLLRQA